VADEDAVPTVPQLNEMMARGEAELVMFNEMDKVGTLCCI
jgi:hypothetical protein